MDGKVATPAALRGSVRTIPEIDKTLSIEGQCADAKATGDALAVRDATLAEHKATLDSHTATLDNHKGALDSHAAMLDEHKTSIDNNAANAEERINAVADRVTAVEGDLTTLTDNFETASGFLTNLNDVVLNDHTPKLATLEERADKMEQDVEEHLMAFDFGIKPKVDGLDIQISTFSAASTKITSIVNEYAKNLYMCSVALNFSVTADVLAGEVLYTGLPKPAMEMRFVVISPLSTDAYPLVLKADGNEGVIVCPATKTITQSTTIVGSITYVTAEDSAV